MRETLERELKLSAPSGFRLPELGGDPLEPRTFTSTYWDTAGHGLAQAGVTLRRRVERRRGLWQLKLPRGSSRLELELPGGASTPPDLFRTLLLAHTRGAELEPLAKLRTRRSAFLVVEDGRPIAEVALDQVAVLRDRRIASRFEELEVELLTGTEKALRRLEKILRAAGAEDGVGRPKVFRALDLAPAEDEAERDGVGGARGALRAMLDRQRRAILAHDPGVRLGTDPEELHQLRVATRRLRAFLRAGRPLLDRGWADRIRSELSWLGSALGPVRDLDVLLLYLRAEAAEVEPDAAELLGGLFATLEAEREEARSRLSEVLASACYFALLDALREIRPGPDSGPTLAEIAAGEFSKLRRAVKQLEPEPGDDELHAVRIKGKRARYAAELAEPEVGKRASRFVERAKELQDVIGEHQDAVVAEARVRALLPSLDGAAAAVAVGRLVERQHARRRRARQAFPTAWKRLDEAGRKAWR